MRVVFIGTVEFSREALLKLLELNVNVVGVVTKEKSEFNADFSNLVDICEERGINCKYVNNINHPNNVKWIKQLKPDILFCFGWSSLLKPEVLNLAPHGVLGFHPALIPANRGRHPIIWALALGLDKTGSTFFFMDEGADTGDILNQKEVLINCEDDAASLYIKIIKVALGQIEEFIPKLISGKYKRIKQVGEGNTWRKRGEKDGEIDWRMSSKSIINLVKALTRPYLGAHFVHNNEEYKVWRCVVEATEKMTNIEPGKVLKIEADKMLVKTGDGALWLTEYDQIKDIAVGQYI
ncbi:methionyl-tRNA formyltransferase [Pontibacter ramchanderi]|uniref:Methionyl-tRNA formyltransferase n=1 Tax=Pontibacter ramchanderi TaxID=1179743 RepID=A0A2N3U8Z4_9BACT|nr:formyltransferase family protein [Pontibacter ramchanderi]PKV63229.1 methionyl-tRNA formyltransferase [Pontibacter ramchanderi]